MTFRDRLTLVAAAALAVGFALAAGGSYVAARSVLLREIDRSLEQRRELVVPLAGGRTLPVGSLALGGAASGEGLIQIVNAGTLRGALPVDERTRRVARGRERAFTQNVEVGGTQMRVLTAPLARGQAVQVARPLTEVHRILGRLAWILGGFALAGIVVAALLGRVVARTALAPVRRLSATARDVASTQDLRRRIDASGRDELADLAGSFNAMLEALEQSRAAQRRLVADASHELRTPLTSLRTNVEVLARPDALSRDERERVIVAVDSQLQDLTTLVGDVIELARGSDPDDEPDDVRLDLVVQEAVERASRDAPSITFRSHLEPCIVHGVAHRLARAAANLLENAAKWSPAGGVVDISLADGVLSVRDRGPGIDEVDLSHVFDRFYRAPSARRLPGSGLGLAIVRDVAEAHGGRVTAEAAAGGGALLRVELPAQTPRSAAAGDSRAARVAG